MTFGNAQLAWHFLWLIPALAAILWLGRRMRHRRLQRLIPDAGQRDSLSATVGRKRRILRTALLLTAALAVAVAMLRPQYGRQPAEFRIVGRDVIVVLDVSRSMLARDVSPNRLKHAKRLIKELADALPDDRFGLVVFAGKGLLSCPLTINRESFFMLLDEVDTRSLPTGGTNLQDALTIALKAFRGAESDHRGIIVISDGEELQGQVDSVFDDLRARGIVVHTVGVGEPSSGAYIQLADGEFVTQNGKRVETRLHEETLQQIANAGGGLYIHSTAEVSGAAQLANEIRQLNPAESDRFQNWRPIDRYQWPLAVAIALLAIRFLVGERRRKTAPAAVLLVLLVFPAFAQDAEDTQVRRWKAELKTLETTEARTPILWKLAQRYQELGQASNAERAYDEILGAAGVEPATRRACLQNLGAIPQKQAAEQLADDPDAAVHTLTSAIRHYRAALLIEETEALQNNLALALKQLREAKRLAEEKRRRQKLLEEARQQVQRTLDRQQDANESRQMNDQKTAAETGTKALPAVEKTEIEAAAKLMRKAIAEQSQAVAEQVEAARVAQGQVAEKTLVEVLRELGVTRPDEDSQKEAKKPANPKLDPNDPEAQKNKKAIAILRRMLNDEKRYKQELMKKRENETKAEGGRNW